MHVQNYSCIVSCSVSYILQEDPIHLFCFFSFHFRLKSNLQLQIQPIWSQDLTVHAYPNVRQYVHQHWVEFRNMKQRSAQHILHWQFYPVQLFTLLAIVAIIFSVCCTATATFPGRLYNRRAKHKPSYSSSSSSSWGKIMFMRHSTSVACTAPWFRSKPGTWSCTGACCGQQKRKNNQTSWRDEKWIMGWKRKRTPPRYTKIDQKNQYTNQDVPRRHHMAACAAVYCWLVNYVVFPSHMLYLQILKILIKTFWIKNFTWALCQQIQNHYGDLMFDKQHKLHVPGYSCKTTDTAHKNGLQCLLTTCAPLAPTLARWTINFLSPSCIPFSPAHA